VIRKATDLVDTILKEGTMNHKSGNNPGVPVVVEEAQARAGMYGFLATLYNQRPDADLVRRLRTVKIETFIGMTQEDISPEIDRGLGEMARFVHGTMNQEVEEVEQTLGVDWTRLFRGVSPNYGPTPPYEGVYQGGQRDPVEVLQEVNRIYHESGVTIGEESPNRPDYIGLEFDFLRYLAERELEAWEQEEEDLALSYADKAKAFFEEHPGGWVWKFCDQALEHTRTDFYKGLLMLTKGVLAGARDPKEVQ
jgi:TorA maturation chaperone TorD